MLKEKHYEGRDGASEPTVKPTEPTQQRQVKPTDRVSISAGTFDKMVALIINAKHDMTFQQVSTVIETINQDVKLIDEA